MTFFVIAHCYCVFTSSAQGGQILFHEPLFCPIFFLITFLSHFYSIFTLYNYFSLAKGVNCIAKTDGGMAGSISPPGSATDSSYQNGLPLALRSLPRVFSQKFLQQLKTTLFGSAGVGSISQ